MTMPDSDAVRAPAPDEGTCATQRHQNRWRLLLPWALGLMAFSPALAQPGGDRPPLRWMGTRRPAAAVAVLETLDHLDTRGITVPRDRIRGIRRQMAALTAFPSREELLEIDTALTTLVAAAVRTLLLGELVMPPGSGDAGTWMDDTVRVTDVVTQLALGQPPEGVLDTIEPAYPGFQRLKQAWGRLRESPGDSIQLHKVALAMDRWRWLPQSVGTAAVLVNIPAYRLEAIQRDGAEVTSALAMDVAVGSAGPSRTPLMHDSIQSVVFAPAWNVPLSITRAELLPIATRDPYLLTLNGYEIISPAGRRLPATAASVAALRRGQAFVRQLPGGTNALGRVKFLFPNVQDIYLHDTPRVLDFTRARRDISHGCVRLSQPAAMAAWLLGRDQAWSLAQVDTALRGKSPLPVSLRRPVPVHLVYMTAEATATGDVVLYEDVYGHDDLLLTQWRQLRDPTLRR